MAIALTSKYIKVSQDLLFTSHGFAKSSLSTVSIIKANPPDVSSGESSWLFDCCSEASKEDALIWNHVGHLEIVAPGFTSQVHLFTLGPNEGDRVSCVIL